VLECCRRNNTDLLQEVLHDISRSTASKQSPAESTAELLNRCTDGIGNHCLHVAATYGSYDVLDLLLDQEGLEVDPVDRLEADTPLHKAVRFTNGLEKESWESGKAIVELLLDAGADPRYGLVHCGHVRGTLDLQDTTFLRTRNKAKLKAMDLVEPANLELRSVLQKAEFAMMAGNDVVQDDDDDGPTGSASDSE
jgi:ankyrin repeat protein